MANKGEHKGKRIMTEKAWDNFHGDAYLATDQFIGLNMAFTNGGVGMFDTSTPGLTHKELDMDFWKIVEAGDGFYGWMGYGGSMF